MKPVKSTLREKMQDDISEMTPELQELLKL
jgi:hypothetical protein